MKKILYVLGNLVSFLLGVIIMLVNSQLEKRKKALQPSEKNDELLKWKEFYRIFNQWLLLKQKGNGLDAYFTCRNYERIAVYGMKELGERLIDELKDTSILVVYGIDKNAKNLKKNFPMYTMQDNLPEVDIIVVTAVHYYAEIKEELNSICSYPVVSLTEVVETLRIK